MKYFLQSVRGSVVLLAASGGALVMMPLWQRRGRRHADPKALCGHAAHANSDRAPLEGGGCCNLGPS